MVLTPAFRRVLAVIAVLVLIIAVSRWREDGGSSSEAGTGAAPTVPVGVGPIDPATGTFSGASTRSPASVSTPATVSGRAGRNGLKALDQLAAFYVHSAEHPAKRRTSLVVAERTGVEDRCVQTDGFRSGSALSDVVRWRMSTRCVLGTYEFDLDLNGAAAQPTDRIALYFDLDGEQTTGCSGDDYAAGGPLTAVSVYRIVSCDLTKWETIGAASATMDATTLRVSLPQALIGSPDSVLWQAFFNRGVDQEMPGHGDYVLQESAPVTDDPCAPTGPAGYWMMTDRGAMYGFGGATTCRARGAKVDFATGERRVTDFKADGASSGFWTTFNDGVVLAEGDATYYGEVYELPAGETLSSISPTESEEGYWLFTTRGRVITYGDAAGYGDMTQQTLNGPVRGSIATATGNGYYMVASDGGVFAFGDGAFFGSMGGTKLNAPVVSMVPTPTGLGYWQVATDGGIFAFGDAPFRGSMGGTKLNKPVRGMVRFGNGYLMVAEDGGIFNFSNLDFFGSLGGSPPADPVVVAAAFGS